MPNEKDTLAVQLLQQLVELCKRDLLVAVLAEVLDVTPQSVYAWTAPQAPGRGPVIKGRTAKQRLLEISRLKHEKLLAVAKFANEAVEQIESADAGVAS